MIEYSINHMLRYDEPAYTVLRQRHFLAKIYAFLPGRRAVEWTNATKAIYLGHYRLLQDFGENMCLTAYSMTFAARQSDFEIFKWVVHRVHAGC